MNFSFLILGVCFVLISACDSGGVKSPKAKQSVSMERQEDSGIYRAVLGPLNESVAGQTGGTVEIRIAGDEFIAQATVHNAPAGVKHLQHIMSGTRCPSASSDKNNDGFIDIQEGMSVFGKILIPLDSNLREQIAGMDFGPIANSAGSYVYRRSTSLSSLLADLRAPDPDTHDDIVKLPFGEDLNMSGRVVIIHGVSSQEPLSDSVATTGTLTPAQAMPIACGKLVRVVSE